MRQTIFLYIDPNAGEDNNLVFGLREYKKYTKVTFYTQKGIEAGSNTFWNTGNVLEFDRLTNAYKEEGYLEVKFN